MTPEQKARRQIDQQLGQCGWAVQDYRQMNISAGLGIAVREFPLSTGDADYLLYIDGKACGVVEANRLMIRARVRHHIDELKDRFPDQEIHNIGPPCPALTGHLSGKTDSERER